MADNNCHLIVPVTVQLIWYPAQLPRGEEYSHYHNSNQNPWNLTSRKNWLKASSDPLHPQHQLDSSSSRKKMVVWDPALIIAAFTTSPFNFDTPCHWFLLHSNSSVELKTSLNSTCAVLTTWSVSEKVTSGKLLSQRPLGTTSIWLCHSACQIVPLCSSRLLMMSSATCSTDG